MRYLLPRFDPEAEAIDGKMEPQYFATIVGIKIGVRGGGRILFRVVFNGGGGVATPTPAAADVTNTRKPAARS
jgi:hypothetical protein